MKHGQQMEPHSLSHYAGGVKKPRKLRIGMIKTEAPLKTDKETVLLCRSEMVRVPDCEPREQRSMQTRAAHRKQASRVGDATYRSVSVSLWRWIH